MRKTRLFIFMFLLIMSGLAGYYGYQYFNKGGSESAVASLQDDVSKVKAYKVHIQGAKTKVTVDEARKLLKTLYGGVTAAFRELGAQYNWSNAVNPADFSKLRPELLQYASKSFTDGELQKLAKEYYCECDAPYFPDSNEDIRLNMIENSGKKFVVSTFSVKNDMEDGGEVIYFTFVREKGEWKLDGWKRVDGLQESIEITADELLAHEKQFGAGVKVIHEAKWQGRGILVLFYEGEGYTNLKTVYTDDTDFMYGASIPAELIPDDYEDEYEELGGTTVSNTASNDDYLAKLAKIETQVRASSTGVTSDMLADNEYNYKLWNDALNEIYSALQNQLSESEMKTLREKQRQWIEDREQAAQASYDEEGGGSLSVVLYGETFVEVTRERCYELIDLYMRE